MKIEIILLNPDALRGAFAATPAPASRPFAATDTVTNMVLTAAEETRPKQPMPPVLPALAEPEVSARGAFGCEDIERKLHAESRAGEIVPDFDTLRRFRRLNRSLIETALEKVLRTMRLREVRPVQANTAMRTDIGAETAVLLHHEATARIEEAILLDHAAGGE